MPGGTTDQTGALKADIVFSRAFGSGRATGRTFDAVATTANMPFGAFIIAAALAYSPGIHSRSGVVERCWTHVGHTTVAR